MSYYDQPEQPSAPHYSHHPTPRMVFDGKRMRKPIVRRTVDYNSVILNHIQNRVFHRDQRDIPALQPSPEYVKDLQPVHTVQPVHSFCTKFIHTSTNKVRCPINAVLWTPEGRRLITGSSSGEFTLWNGLTFNFETILQAHDTAVRAMMWSHNDNWMVTGDHGGHIKYWQSNMNNVKAFHAHKEAVRDLSFCPTDLKFASCSDDVTVKIWDFARCKEEHELTGHGWDVKCVAWHPQKSLLVSGSKDNYIKLWDCKSGKIITTLHAHKNTVLQVKWNQNGNWLISASRDQLLKLYDIRMMKEMQTFRGHKREVTSVSWHPFQENLLVSGGFDGSIIYWLVGMDEPQAEIAGAHESSVWDLQWHPVGHILTSGSNDHTTKFWCRPRPGDQVKDRYNPAKLEEEPDSTPSHSSHGPSEGYRGSHYRSSGAGPPPYSGGSRHSHRGPPYPRAPPPHHQPPREQSSYPPSGGYPHHPPPPPHPMYGGGMPPGMPPPGYPGAPMPGMPMYPPPPPAGYYNPQMMMPPPNPSYRQQ